jgi:aminomethyltransferase
MAKQTPLYTEHQRANAQLVDFAGWDMPLHYGSQIQEHHHVRQAVSMFDVSHMAVLDVTGTDSYKFLRYVLANDVAKLNTPDRALYTCLLNPQGGIIDDLIVYYLSENYYRIVLNASRREVNFAWFTEQSTAFEVSLDLREDLCIIAVQGPKAIATVIEVMGESWQELAQLKPFHTMTQDNIQIARTGYTGEDGVEIIVPADETILLWQRLVDAGVEPCGLGARDTLRLEAGLNLYGADMTTKTSPLISNLAWTVSFKDPSRQFIGRAALEAEQAKGLKQQLVGLIMEDKGVLRNNQAVFCEGEQIGEITSGSFSPTLGQAIALARINTDVNKSVYIERRGKKISVKIVRPPFVRFGEKVYEVYNEE